MIKSATQAKRLTLGEGEANFECDKSLAVANVEGQLTKLQEDRDALINEKKALR